MGAQGISEDASTAAGKDGTVAHFYRTRQGRFGSKRQGTPERSHLLNLQVQDRPEDRPTDRPLLTKTGSKWL